MRHFPTLLSHEIRTLLFSASTYVAAVLFLFTMGFIFAGILESFARTPQETPPAAMFFELFWFPVLFMVPLLTMKSIADERRQGTLETLLTAPISAGEVVLAKFGAAYVLYLLMWGSTYGFHVILDYYAHDARFIEPGPLLGGYLFIAVSGLLYIAVGIFASSLTRSQAVAGILSFTILLGLIGGLSYVSELGALGQDFLSPLRTTLEGLRIPGHVDDFTHGIVDTRQVFFYLTGAILALLFSILGVEAKILQG